MELVLLIEVSPYLSGDQYECRDHYRFRDQSRYESRREVSFSKERTKLIDQERDGVACAELQTDGAPEPSSALLPFSRVTVSLQKLPDVSEIMSFSRSVLYISL